MSGMKKFNEKHIPKSIRNVTGIAATDKMVDKMGKLFGGSPAPAPAPVPEPEPVMPIPDDAAVNMAKKKSLASQKARRGRVSTIFTNDGDLLGG